MKTRGRGYDKATSYLLSQFEPSWLPKEIRQRIAEATSTTRRFKQRVSRLFVLAGAAVTSASAQEMPKGLALTAELGQRFGHVREGNDRYLATLQLSLQWTVVPGRLRTGPTPGVFYSGTRLGALAGGRLTLRIVQGPPVFLGSSFHGHLLGEYLPLVWTSPNTWRQWVGAGMGLETTNLVSLLLNFTGILLPRQLMASWR